MPKYIVTSQIKFNGVRYSEGAEVSLPEAIAAKLNVKPVAATERDQAQVDLAQKDAIDRRHRQLLDAEAAQTNTTPGAVDREGDASRQEAEPNKPGKKK